MKTSPNWAQVSAHFRECFPDVRPQDWRLIYVKFSNKLSQKGDVRRSIKIRLESLVAGLDHYQWIVPLPKTSQTELYDLSIQDEGGQFLHHEVRFLKKDKWLDLTPICAQIKISFAPISEGDKITIIISYLLESYSEEQKRGWNRVVRLWGSTWKYSWSYHVLSETHKLIHEVRLPTRCRLLKYEGDISNAGQAAKFRFDDEDIVIWTMTNPTGGDLFGELMYRQESVQGAPITIFISSVILTILITICLSSISGNPIEWISVLEAFGLAILGILVTFLLMKMTLPTLQ